MSAFSNLRRLSIVVASCLSMTVATSQVAGAIVCDAAWRVQSAAAFPSGAELTDVAVTATGETWAVGKDGNQALLAHFVNGAWATSRYSVAGQVVSLDSVDAQPGIAWAVGRVRPDVFQAGSAIVLVNNGSGWRRQPLPAQVASGGLSSVVIRSRTDVWMAGGFGDHPRAVHWDGSRMTATTLPFSGFADAVEAPPDGGVTLFGFSWSRFNAAAWRWTGYQWVQDRLPPSFGEEFFPSSVDGTRTNTWGVITGIGGCCSTFPTVYHWNGSRWTENTPDTGGSELRDLLVSRPDGHVIVVGTSPCGDGCGSLQRGEVWEWTGSRWVERQVIGLSSTTASRLVAIDGDGNASRWAVGNGNGGPLLIRQCAAS